jgi:hypothetical protein
MLALGGRCSVGDQLHPSGVLDPATYDLIGSAYAQIAALEPWHEHATPAVDIAVVHTEPYAEDDSRVQNSNVGAYRLLTELRQQFDFVDEDADLSRYRLLILPDVIPVNPAYAAKIEAFLAAGGSLIVSGRSGEGLSALPGAFGDTPAFRPGFVQASADFAAGLADRQFVVYAPFVGLVPQADSTVLGELYQPYFTRTFAHFCSHAHAPVEGRSGLAAVLQRGNVIQFAPSVFAEYAEHPALEVKALVSAALNRLLPVPLVSLVGPSSVQVHALENGEDLIVHVMHYLPERRGTRLDIVEDRLPVRATTLTVRGQFASAWSLPDETPLTVRPAGETTEVDLPDFDGPFVLRLAK